MKKEKVLIIAAVLSAVLLYACSGPMSGGGVGGVGGTGTLTITIGDVSRTALFGDPNTQIEDLENTIRLFNGPGPEQTRTGVRVNETANFTVITGRWEVSVKAYDKNGELKAEGSTIMDVQPGPNGAVRVQMKQPGGDDGSQPGGDDGDGGITITYTVTFISNGGTAVASQTVVHGGNVTALPTLNRADSGENTFYAFAGWYREAALTTVWNATDTVTGNITLYAKWTPIKTVGETGPGGGKIFYVSNTGFTVEMVNPAENYTANYLEAASQDNDSVVYWWTSNMYDSKPLVGAFDEGIGYGKRNTDKIKVKTIGLTDTYGNPAESKAVDYCLNLVQGGYNDWFMPSIEELEQLHNSGLGGLDLTKNYLSSTEVDIDYAYVLINGNRNQEDKRDWSGFNVRPIRAF